MKHYRWEIRLGLSLIVLSALLYFIHYLIFRDVTHIFLWVLTSIAFLPISVLFVTLIVNRLLINREKNARLEKLNMVIGAFFSEVGTRLLVYFSDFDPKLGKIRGHLVVTNDWDEEEFLSISQRLRHFDYSIDIERLDLEVLRNLLVDKREFLLRLLENPALLEHETFTKLLRSVFHLTEELANRKDLGRLPDTDYEHLATDIKRAYILLVYEWLNYMKYLKNNYPFLFSLAMRTNPFDLSASPEVR